MSWFQSLKSLSVIIVNEDFWGFGLLVRQIENNNNCEFPLSCSFIFISAIYIIQTDEISKKESKIKTTLPKHSVGFNDSISISSIGQYTRITQENNSLLN